LKSTLVVWQKTQFRIEGDYVLPMHLHSLQDLNVRVGEFFDEALYFLARGHEAEARQSMPPSSGDSTVSADIRASRRR